MSASETQEWYDFNAETIEALTEDGSDISQPHLIEYHLASQNFDLLEKAAVDVFKAGFEVDDAEEFELDDGGIIYVFDAKVERMLNIETINKDTDTILKIADKHGVEYDGWGTYFIEKGENQPVQ